MKFLSLLLLALIALSDETFAKKPTHKPTPKRKPTLEPTQFPTQARTTSNPSFALSADAYYYISNIYYERANYTLRYFPHQGPSYYNALSDKAKGRFYLQQAIKEKAAEKAATNAAKEDAKNKTG